MPSARMRASARSTSATAIGPPFVTAKTKPPPRMTAVRSTTRELQRVLQPPLLARGQFVVAHHDLGADPGGDLLQLVDLARSQVGGRVRAVTVLHRAASVSTWAVRSSSSISASSSWPSLPGGRLAMITARSGAPSSIRCRDDHPTSLGSGRRLRSAGGRYAQVLLDAADRLAQALVGHRQRDPHVTSCITLSRGSITR